MERKVLGVLGGLGPMSSAYFYRLVTENTMARTDQEHLDIVISSKASTPDRSAFILGTSKEDPLPVMVEEAKKLVAFGAGVIALTCNTAHFFYEGLQQAVAVPVLNIGELAVEKIQELGINCVGLLSTTGTAECGIYQFACSNKCIGCIVPKKHEQEEIMRIIYEIKEGKEPDLKSFFQVADGLKANGAKGIILGCTELSLIKSFTSLSSEYLDPLEILAKASITACGYPTR